jgi:hypothetical protein
MAERVRPLTDVLERSKTFGFLDDFEWYVTAHRWTSLVSDTNSSVAVDADLPGGVLVINTGDNTDNNEAAVKSTNEIILPAPGKPWLIESRIQYTEINTDDANVAFGAMDVMGTANTILDNGSNLAASFYGAVIYKLDGSTAWKCAVSAGTFSSTGSLATSAQTAGGSSYQTLRIQGLPVNRANVSEVTFYMDDLPLTDSSTGKPIILYMTHGAQGTGDLDVGVYAKNGATDNTLTVNVDYIAVAQQRST